MKRSRALSHAARIWTFDGGGPSVISQLIIVNEIMYRIQWTLKLPNVPRPCDYAELMVGTGLGAVAVILMGRLCLTAEEALIHVIQLGKSVFTPTDEAPDGPLFDLSKLKSGVTAILEHHGFGQNTKMIEEVFIEGETCTAILTTPALNLLTCRALRTYSVGYSDSNLTIVEAIMATMATPNWFEPVTIGPPHAQETLIGGAMGFNNPTNEGLEEAKRLFGPDQPVALIVSFGSGQKESPKLENSTSEGLAAALERAMTDSEKTAGEMSRRLASTSIYYRFSVDKGVDTVNITGWDDAELGTISSRSKDYNAQVSPSLDSVVELLITKKGSVTLGQITQAAAKTATTTTKRVPTLTPYYVPREDVYQAMRQSLLEGSEGLRIFVLCGMAGVGKTQSSSYYEHINYKKYNHVFFIDASSAANIEADLQSAVRSLGGTHSQATYEDALRFLSHPDSGNWLVILDSADDPALPLRKYLPKSREGSMIITTRNAGLVKLAPTSHWRLMGMEEKEAMSVLLRSAHLTRPVLEDDEKYGREIYVALGGLPLALVQAGSYCFSSGISFRQYLERFKRYRAELMNTQLNSQVDEYNYSAYASIRLSYSLLDAPTQSLLHLLAFFHPSTIHLDILRIAEKYHFTGDPESECLPWDDHHRKGLDRLRQLLTPNGEWNELYIDKLLHQLQTFSLISLSSSTGTTTGTIHPLIQSCMQDALSVAEYSLYFHMAVRALSSCIQDEEIPIFQHLVAHIAEIETRGVKMHVNNVNSFAYVFWVTGSHEAAMKKWDEVKEECGRVQGYQHRSTLRVSFRTAGCLFNLRRYKEAEMAMKEIVTEQEKVLGEEDDDTLDSYGQLARVITKLGRTKESEVILKRLLASFENKYGSGHNRTLWTQLALADNLFVQNNYSEAETIVTNALPAMTKMLGENHSVTQAALNLLSRVLIKQGKWKDAETILENLVTLSNRVYGKENDHSLDILFNLSLCLQNRKNWTEAERIQREVLDVRERTLGKDNPKTIETHNALNETLQAMQELTPLNNASQDSMLKSPLGLQPTDSPLSRPSQLEKSLKPLGIMWGFVISTSFILLKYHLFEHGLFVYLLIYFFYA